MTPQEFKFIEASKRERWALQYVLPSNTKYTKIKSYIRYDALTEINNQKFIVEAKIRDTHYNQLMYETIKHNDLMEISNRTNTPILFICFTPEGTFIFNITKLLKTNPELFTIETLNAPHSTMGNNTYEDKTTYLLPIEYSKQHKFKFTAKQYFKEVYNEEL